jgi:hypothetical protein
MCSTNEKHSMKNKYMHALILVSSALCHELLERKYLRAIANAFI